MLRTLARNLILFSFLWTDLAAHAAEITVEQDLVYGMVDETELKLNLAHPRSGVGPFPALVFVHGGGWVSGARESFQAKIEQAARKGYVAVSINYRLTQPDPETELGKVPFPAQIQDCQCAVRWLRSVANKYHIQSDKIGVLGASAGGQLALLMGLADEQAGFESVGGHAEHSQRVQAVVNIFGPTDLSKAYLESKELRPFLKALCQGTPTTNEKLYKLASPVTYVTKNEPPVLSIHGDKDPLVPVEQARLLDETMKEVGAHHELLILEGQGHGFTGEAAQRAEDAIWEFFERYLQKSTSSTN